MKKLKFVFLVLLVVVIIFRLTCGIFVIQPIGAIPEGTTIVYIKKGLNIPFIASADGILAKSEAGVSLFGRAILIGKLAEPVTENELFRFGYSETLYLWSTDGKTYGK